MESNTMENFKTKLFDLFKKDARLWNEKTKELNETLLKDLIDKLDEKLIELLMSDKEAKDKFFLKIKDWWGFCQKTRLGANTKTKSDFVSATNCFRNETRLF